MFATNLPQSATLFLIKDVHYTAREKSMKYNFALILSVELRAMMPRCVAVPISSCPTDIEERHKDLLLTTITCLTIRQAITISKERR
jgi:hypothetical protein